MRVVQVANFYGPRSGGLRTAVDRLGAEYCAAGHEVFLIVPGRHAEHSDLATGVVRITVPARLIPFTGGYRAVLPGPVRTLHPILEQIEEHAASMGLSASVFTAAKEVFDKALADGWGDLDIASVHDQVNR